MENKIQEDILGEAQKNLSDLKEQATKTVNGFMGVIDIFKKDLDPEGQKIVKEKMEKIQLKSTMDGFDEANKLISDFLKNK